MKELSLHIMDIVQNSIRAKATLIEIRVTEEIKENLLSIKILDNGWGMDEETRKKVIDPFWTSRTTRNVGLGIPLFKSAAERCNGSFKILSEVGKGTEILAEFERDHIDRAPIGDMADTISLIIMTNEDIDFIYIHSYNQEVYELDTREIKKVLGGMPISNLDVIDWIKKDIKEGLAKIGANRD